MGTHPRWGRFSLASNRQKKGCFVPPSLGSALYPGALSVAHLLRLGHPPCVHQEENLVSFELHFFIDVKKIFFSSNCRSLPRSYSWFWVTDKERGGHRVIFFNYIISCKVKTVFHLKGSPAYNVSALI